MDKRKIKRKINKETSTGLDQNIAGLLSYLFGFVTGIIFLIIEKKNRFVRFHAMQSTITFLSLFVIGIVVNVIFIFIPIIGWFFAWLISFILWIISLVLWILGMVKAYNNEMYKFPIFGGIAEKHI